MKTRLILEMAKDRGFKVQVLAPSEYQIEGKFHLVQFFDDRGKAICVEVKSKDSPEEEGLYCKSLQTEIGRAHV